MQNNCKNVITVSVEDWYAMFLADKIRPKTTDRNRLGGGLSPNVDTQFLSMNIITSANVDKGGRGSLVDNRPSID